MHQCFAAPSWLKISAADAIRCSEVQERE
jgi:hypothetical protein